jgi:hypothetical protein
MTRRARNTINSILARNQARRHWVYSGNYPEHSSLKNARNAETKHQSGAEQTSRKEKEGEERRGGEERGEEKKGEERRGEEKIEEER